MLTLDGPDDCSVQLAEGALIGRSSRADLRIDDTLVSAEHAVLRWRAGHWELRDLGSRNGTFVDGRRLAPGERGRLLPDSEVSFGDARVVWRVGALRPPVPAANRADGTAVFGAGELLALPSDDTPELTVFLEDGAWLAEREEAEPFVVESGDVVNAGGDCWTLLLPSSTATTVTAGELAPSVRTAAIAFRVSADEEHVVTEVRERGRVIDLGSRAHHYLLLTLGRARLADREQGVDPREEGWMYQSDLVKGLRLAEPQLYVAIHRARRQLADAGVRDARRIVERRRASGQIRLGMRDVSVISSAS